jgi:tetratricopeptide (TPR) repeat protein
LDDAELARSLEAEASKAQKEGRFADAEPPLRRAIAIWTRLGRELDGLNAEMNLAVSYRRRGEASRAVMMLERIVTLLGNDPLVLNARNNLAAAYRATDQLARARLAWEENLRVLGLGEERARVLDNLSALMRDLKDYRAAEDLARQGLAEWLSLRGANDPDTATSKATLGAALLDRDRLDEATKLLFEALETFEAHGPELGVAATMTLIGALGAKRGDKAAARTAYERALTLSRKYLRDDHPDVRAIVESLAAL